MLAVSFLGKGSYQEVTYTWQDQECRTDLFPEAVVRIFEPERLIVLVTEEVKRDKNFQALQERLSDKLQPIDIPSGRSVEELWAVFERCAEAIPEGAEILLDITLAFRSLPLIVFAVAAYLRRTKRVTIRHIVYGAYEARDERARAPIFDLTSLLDLLDWLSGAEALLKRADGMLLAERLREVQNRLRRQGGENLPEELKSGGENLPEELKSLGNLLEEFSLDLWLNRPREGMQKAHKLVETLKKAEPEVYQWAKPFGVILEQIRRELELITYETPDVLNKESLIKQEALISYYLKKGLIIQAVTLAREWVVNWVMLHRSKGDWLKRDDREVVERALGGAAQKRRDNPAEVSERVRASDEAPEWWESFPKKDEVVRIWNELGQLRNDLAHCGMTKGAASIKSIQERANKIPELLKTLSEKSPEGSLIGGRVVIDLKDIYGEVAKLDELPNYLEQAKALAGEGNDVVLTGQAPVWLYLAVAHTLHGVARRLWYTSPVTGELLIFDHSAR